MEVQMTDQMCIALVSLCSHGSEALVFVRISERLMELDAWQRHPSNTTADLVLLKSVLHPVRAMLENLRVSRTCGNVIAGSTLTEPMNLDSDAIRKMARRDAGRNDRARGIHSEGTRRSLPGLGPLCASQDGGGEMKTLFRNYTLFTGVGSNKYKQQQ